MKKIFSVSVLAIVILSSLVIAENEDSVPGLLSQIKEVLLDMLEQLNIIAEKDIIFPKTECQWEKVNQMISLSGSEGGFVLPNELDYLDMKLQKVSVAGECSGDRYSGCGLMFNDLAGWTNRCLAISCYGSPCNKNLVYDVTANCLSELVEGVNDFSTVGSFDIKELYVEMEVLPVNC